MNSKKPFVKNYLIRMLVPLGLLVLVSYFIFSFSKSVVAGVSQIVSLLFAVMLIRRGLKESYIFNPYLFFSICPLTLAAYFPVISGFYLLDFSETTYLYAIANMICFYLGMEMAHGKRIYFGHDFIGSYNRWPSVESNIYVARWARIFTIIGFLPAVYALGAGSLGNWNNLKVYASSFPFYAIIAYFPYTGIYLALRSKKKRTIIFALVLGGITTLVVLTKTMVMFYIISLLAGYEKKSGAKGTKKLMVIGVLSLFVFSYLDDVYNQIRDATQYEALWLSRSGGILSVSQLKTYLYFETPWCNLEYILRNLNSHSYGLWAIKPFLTLFRLDGIFHKVYETMQPYTTFNALGYIVYVYQDFGYIGSCIAIALLGFFVSYIYERGNETDNPFWGAIVMFVLRAVMMMFFNLHFNTEIYVLSTIIIMSIINYFSKRVHT